MCVCVRVCVLYYIRIKKFTDERFYYNSFFSQSQTVLLFTFYFEIETYAMYKITHGTSPLVVSTQSFPALIFLYLGLRCALQYTHSVVQLQRLIGCSMYKY